MSQGAAETTDGTQPGGPGSLFSDPLAGGADGGADRSGANGRAPSAGAAAPDPGTVQGLVDDVFADRTDNASDARGVVVPGTVEVSAGEPIRPTELSRAETPPGMLPRRKHTWPIRKRRSAQVRRGGRGGFAGSLARLRVSRTGEPRRLKPTRGVAGVSVAALLVLLFTAVAVAFVVSFVGMFAGIGG